MRVVDDSVGELLGQLYVAEHFPADSRTVALEMIHAIYESARCHERVSLPLQTRVNPLDLMVESGHLTPERPGRYEIRASRLGGERLWSDGSAQGSE